MSNPLRIHLFQGYGVELEYMIVDRETLKVKPISDKLLKSVLGSFGSDFENGIITWSNELVLHVIELKSTLPESNLPALLKSFHENVIKINGILKDMDAMLLPSGMHPFMNPLTEAKIWPHENNEVYDLYNKIFDCRGHGWSNLQSTHINLPFYDDEEFAKLHAAVRIILPLISALSASTPFVEGKTTGCLDNRLKYYKTNQSKIPSITGRVIPEAVFSRRNYLHSIYDKIKQDLVSYDPTQVLNPIWVNSRGAIARFDRGSLEIRLLDVQECPKSDLAILAFLIAVIKSLVNGKWNSLNEQMHLKTDLLVQIFNEVLIHSQEAIITQKPFLEVFGLSNAISILELFKTIREKIELDPIWDESLDLILNKGNLSMRILEAVNPLSEEKIQEVYHQLSNCLAEDKLFIPQ